jgi:hypothetical protein
MVRMVFTGLPFPSPMVYSFHRYSSGSGREANARWFIFSISTTPVVMSYKPRWFTFSIYAIETYDLKTWTSTHSLQPPQAF